MKLLFALTVVAAASPAFAATGVGPSPYLSFADSPFAGGSYSYFHLEDFEDGVLNTPGITLTAGASAIPFPGPQTDSVDGDDSVIDGLGTAGRSLLALQTNAFRFDFDAAALGGLPTDVGVVWTDVGLTLSTPGIGLVEFRAFDSSDNVVAFVSDTIGDGSTFGATAEDRFFGAQSSLGIAYFIIAMPESSDWEIDHVQYGLQIPGAGAWNVIGLGAFAGFSRRSRRSALPIQP